LLFIFQFYPLTIGIMPGITQYIIYFVFAPSLSVFLDLPPPTCNTLGI